MTNNSHLESEFARIAQESREHIETCSRHRDFTHGILIFFGVLSLIITLIIASWKFSVFGVGLAIFFFISAAQSNAIWNDRIGESQQRLNRITPRER